MAIGYDGSVRIKADLNHSSFDKGLSAMVGSVSKLKGTLSKITSSFGGGLSSATKSIGVIGNSLKKLAGLVAAAFGAAAIVSFSKEAVNAASSLNDAWIGLESIVTGQGKSFSKAKSFINDYISDGLVPLQDAVTAYKNLAARGYDSEQIEKTMTALKDAAAFGRQSSYTLGEAVSSATEGLKNENSILVDNAGVTKNVAKMWDDYAKSIGTTANNLTTEQKIQAEVNGIMEETRFQTGDAAKLVNTYSGQIALLGYNFQNLKVQVGNAIMPIVQAVLPGINTIISALTKLATVFAQVTALLFGKSAQVKTQSGIASSANSAAEATDNLAESTSGAGSAAKQAAKDMKGVLAGFDELNILADNAADSLGSASGGIENSVPDLGLSDIDTSGELFSDVTISPKLLAEIEALKDALRRIWEVFKESWSLNGPSVVEAAKRLLISVYELLKSIGTAFTEAWTGGAGLEFLNSVFTLLATILNIIADIADAWATAFANVGQEFFESILFKFTALLELINSIGEAFREVWNNGTGVEICETILSILTNINNTIGTIYKKIQEAWEANGNGVAIWQAILDIVQDVLDFINELASATLEWAGNLNLEPLMSSFRGLLEAIEPLVDAISGGLAWAYENVLLPLASWVLEEAAPASVDTLSAAIDALTAILSPLIEGFKSVYSALQPLIEWIQDVAIIVIEGLGGIFRSVADTFQEHGPQIQEIISHISDAVSSMWETVEPIFNLLKSLVEDVFNFWEKHISDKIGAVLDTLDGLIKFIDGVFSGDWKEAWEGIKEAFSGPVKFILGWLEDLIAFVKDAAKAVGDFFSSYSSGKASSFSGSRTTGGGGRVAAYSLPEMQAYNLPRLANGAVIPPNRQFAAILGDQRSGMNIEAPLKTIEQAVRNVMGESGFGGDVVVNLTAELDGKVLTKKVIRVANAMTRSSGKPVFNT